MSVVPTKILVGPTTYVHFRRKHKDYYVPDFLISPDVPSPDQSPNVWRYTVSPDHHNTVFFFNAVTQKSVWVLPIVHPDGRTEELGEGEVMHAIRAPIGESSSLQPSDSRSNGSEREQTTTATATREIPEVNKEELSESAETRKEKDEKVTGASVVESAGEKPNPSTDFVAAITKAMSDSPHVGTTQQVSPIAYPQSSSGTIVAQSGGSVSRERVQAAVQRAQLAAPLTISISADGVAAGKMNNGVFHTNESLPSNNSTPSGSLQQRLAAWRAKRHQSFSEKIQSEKLTESPAPHQEALQPVPSVVAEPNATPATTVLADPLFVPTTTAAADSRAAAVNQVAHSPLPAGTPRLVASTAGPPHLAQQSLGMTAAPAVKPLLKTASPLSPNSTSANASAIVKEGTQRHEVSVRSSPQSLKNKDQGAMSSPFSRQLDASTKERLAQEAELAKVTTLLHEEKIRAMEQERAALECRRRALAVEQQEAADRASLMEARAAAERKRVEAEERAEREQNRQQRLLEEKAMAEARVREVNQYVVKHTKMEEEAEATVADSFSYASRIAAQLAASAPGPDDTKSAFVRQTKAVSIDSPAFRDHHVGSADLNSATRTSSFRALQLNTSAGAEPRNENTKTLTKNNPKAPAEPARTHERICYGVPFVYDGEVVDYRPSRTFVQNAQAAALKSKFRGDTALLSDASLLLSVKRDGTGTQYYDANQQRFFTGTWREDKREGAGVLSLSNSAIQGHWARDQLTGSAIVQTKCAKAIAAFTTASSHKQVAPPSSHNVSPAGTKTTSTRGTQSHNVVLDGNAVVELSNKALFVGSLKDGCVGAPYVLQLGEGDYVEWLGPSATSTPGKAKKTGDQKSHLSALRHTPEVAHSLFSSKREFAVTSPTASHKDAAAGTGECRIRFHNGDTYVGHVCDFQLHGTGYYRFAADGQSYTGVFQHGLPHGEGLMIFANGDLYKGEFVKGLFCGHGSYSCKAGGYVYEGDWVEGSMAGEGTLSYANGDVWKGTFCNNERVSGAYTTVA